jgi:hypothetical protein
MLLARVVWIDLMRLGLSYEYHIMMRVLDIHGQDLIVIKVESICVMNTVDPVTPHRHDST